MKKRDLNKMVIIITLITIIILLYIKMFVISDYVNGFKDKQEKDNKQSVERVEKFSLSEDEIIYKEKINELSREITENILIYNNENIKTKSEEKREDGYRKNEEDNKRKNNNTLNNVLNEGEKSVAVFKTDKKNLLNEISFKDKLAVLSIIKNLSSREYKELLNNIKRNDELGAAVDIFTILKDNLSKNDYEELKEIAEPYLNVELIENNIE